MDSSDVNTGIVDHSAHTVDPQGDECAFFNQVKSDPTEVIPYQHPLQIFFEQASDAMAIVDDASRYLVVNPSTCNLLGLPQAEILQHHMIDFVDVDCNFPQIWQRCQQQGSCREWVRVRRWDHSIRDVELQITFDARLHQHLVILRELAAELQREEEPQLKPSAWVGNDRPQGPTELSQSQSSWQVMQQRLHTVIDMVGSGITLSTEQGQFLIFNSQAEAITGYSWVEANNSPNFLALLYPSSDQYQQALERLELLLQQRALTNVETTISTKSGTQKTLLLSSVILENAGSPLFLTVYTDITARKQAELALQESESRFQQIAESIQQVFWMANDTMTQFLYVNAAYEHLWGRSRASLYQDICSWITAIHPEDVERVAQVVKQQRHQGWAIEYRIIQPNGQIRWIWEQAFPILNFQQYPDRVVGVCQDITDRKRTEETLQRYERIVSATPDGMALLDRDYFYLVVNQPYLARHQKTTQEVIGHSIREVLGEESYFSVVKPHLDQAITGKIVRYQSWFSYPHREEQFIEVIYAPYYAIDGEITGVVVTARNLTDLKRAEMALQQQAEQERLLGKITQHIRQSLQLNEILQTAVTEVLDLLHCDRVLIFRLYNHHQGKIEAEALALDQSSLAGATYFSNCLPNCYPEFCQMQPHAPYMSTGSTLDQTSSSCPIFTMLGLEAKAQVFVPILHQEVLWGFLISQQCDQVRYWQAGELDLLTAIANQVSIAIHQSYLYQQVQQLNLELEEKVRERTTELWQALHFEALLKRITDKVRDSLDEAQILQTAVQELAWGVDIEGCDTGLYNAEQTTSTIAYEFVKTLKSAQGRTLTIADTYFVDVYTHYLLRGQGCQFCSAQPLTLRTSNRPLAVLAYPIFDDQGVLGDLWLFKPCEDSFTELEMRLVQQVSTHCAIALRQSRLYQAAQGQVQELERLNLLKDDFLSTISHELRTPMANIKMAARMLEISFEQLQMRESESRIQQYFQILNHECQREMLLINNLLDLSRLDADIEPLIITTIAPSLWIPAIIEPFEERMREHQQQLQVSVPSDLPPIVTDLSYLERILAELLQNACKYTPAGGTISVLAQVVIQENTGRLQSKPDPAEPGSLLQIIISNSGVTIPEHELLRIFDKFYRIPNNDPWKYDGTGLGLTLVKKLVQHLQGKIQVDSVEDQVILTLTLPLTCPSVPPRLIR